MLDTNLIQIIEFINSRKYECIIVPGYAHAILSEETPSVRYYSYIASFEDIDDVDAIVIHKGLMHRIDKRIFLEAYFNWVPVFANDVVCIFTKSGERNLGADLQRQHLRPVENFVAKLHNKHRKVNKPNSAVIVSAYGVQNVGDDLVSIASERMLLDVGIDEVTKSGPSVAIEDIEASDLVVLGGGGLLYDSDQENLENYLYPMRAAASRGKRTAILGVGSQGLHSPIARACTARILRDVDLLSVRSPLDKEVLEGLDSSVKLDVIEGQDMAFYIADDLRALAIDVRSEEKAALFSVSITIKERLAIAGIDIGEACNAIITDLKEKGYKVSLALHSTDDEDFYAAISRRNDVRIVDLASIGIFGTASLYARSDLIITSRFHAIIYGAIFGKSVVSLYGNKCKSGRLLNSYLQSILRQSEEIEKLNLNRLLGKIAHAAPVEASEVQACEKLAKSVKDKLADFITSS